MAAHDLLFGPPANPASSPVDFVFGDDSAPAPPPPPPPQPPVKGELLFSQPANAASGPVDIVFGDDGGTSPPEAGAVNLQASGRITGLRGVVRARVATPLAAAGRITGLRGAIAVTLVPRLQASGRITGLRGSIAMPYDVNVDRPVAGTTRALWQGASPVHAAAQQRFEQARPASAPLQARWQNAAPRSMVQPSRWQQARPVGAFVQQALQQARPVARAPTLQRFEQALRLRATTGQRFEQARPLGAAPTAQRFEDATRLRRLVRSSFEHAAPTQAAVLGSFGHGLHRSRVIVGVYQIARKPAPGISRPAQPQPPEPCYLPTLPAQLVFDAPWSSDTGLVFVCERHGPGPDPEPGETVFVAVKRVYIVQNSITLHRLDTGAPLHAHGFSMSLDYQSWTWQWSASLHHDAAPHLGRDGQGDPPVLVATVNGVPFHLRLEKLSRDRRFMPTRWAVSGRGLAATLAAPWARQQSYSNPAARTAQQLMQDVLTVNGVPMGWALDFGLQDWLVPAGAWALQASPIEAIIDIASAAGGYVQPHATAATLRILPKYPAAPWNWAAQLPIDFDLPKDVAEVEGTEYIDKPAYNRVYIGGQGAGVFGPVTRAGTTGNAIAPQVNHALITHADAHRQRGLAELADTGPQEHITLSLQVLPELGIITPGQTLLYRGHDKNYRGIVRSTAIQWQSPRLRQSLLLETHP